MKSIEVVAPGMEGNNETRLGLLELLAAVAMSRLGCSSLTRRGPSLELLVTVEQHLTTRKENLPDAE